MWLSFSFNISLDQQDILIALLDSIGFEGFEQKDNELIAFIREEDFPEEKLREVVQPFSISFQKKMIQKMNWNEEWEKNFQPIIIENKIAVRASFHTQIKNVEHEIIIDPKMSFGTGHHATTEMMMRLMLTENFSEKSVLDFGCGTGILSILASKLGAKPILAIDHDPWAVENAEENFQLNGIENAEVILSDSIPANRSFNCILANITREIILQQLRYFHQAFHENGILFISGFLTEDEGGIGASIKEFHFTIKQKLISGMWMAMSLEKI